MKVTIFKNVIGENMPSMERYPRELLRCMPGNVTGFTIRARRFPFLRHYFHKEFIYPWVAGRNQAEVNHILDHSYAGLLRFLAPEKTIVTCHDLIPLERPQETSFLGKKRFWHNVKYLPRAAKIIAVSDTTSRSLQRHLGISSKIIQVINSGVARDFRVLGDRAALRKKYGIASPILLHVGSSFPRKNVEIILAALSFLDNAVLIKAGNFTEQQRQLIHRNKIAMRVKELGVIRDTEKLVELYNLADVTIMPSFAEGFGLPALEAMACGCPVMCSDIEVFRELFAGAALFFAPHDAEGLADCLKRLFADSRLRRELIEGGFKKAALLTWERCARKTYEIYTELYSQSGVARCA